MSPILNRSAYTEHLRQSMGVSTREVNHRCNLSTIHDWYCELEKGGEILYFLISRKSLIVCHTGFFFKSYYALVWSLTLLPGSPVTYLIAVRKLVLLSPHPPLVVYSLVSPRVQSWVHYCSLYT